MDELVALIKKKKELSDVPNSLVAQNLADYLRKKSISLPLANKERKLVVGAVRATLRRYTGRYQSSASIRQKLTLLNENKITTLLETHTSTRERMRFYPQLQKLIAQMHAYSILDIGCGLNPLAVAQKGQTYYAYDIKDDDITVVTAYFEMCGITGTGVTADIQTVQSFPHTDVTLIFKVLDIVAPNKYALSKELLTKISSPTIIVSFSTRTLSGKKMNSPRRRWFEQLLSELKYAHRMIASDNELFYIIQKN